jgi:hypothetical protein
MPWNYAPAHQRTGEYGVTAQRPGEAERLDAAPGVLSGSCQAGVDAGAGLALTAGATPLRRDPPSPERNSLQRRSRGHASRGAASRRGSPAGQPQVLWPAGSRFTSQ